MNDNEFAFYIALAENHSARDVMGDAQLKVIATELITKARESTAIDWQHRESARARIRVLIKRILRTYGYPPDLQDAAMQAMSAQTELSCADWAEAGAA